MKARLHRNRRASSLIITLLVIVVLTVIVVAFMQSMSLERRVAASYLNVTKAQLAAEAAASDASATLKQLYFQYPDSATAWVTNMAPAAAGKQTPGTAFFYYNTVSVTNSSFTNTPDLYFRPLVSGATNVLVANKADALKTFTDPTNYVNINNSNYGDGRLWVGAPPGATDLQISVPWVYLTNNAGVTNARYAYWVEDESFRVNVSTATNVVRGSSSMGTNASEIPLQGAMVMITNIASGERGDLANKISDLRTNLPFDNRFLNLSEINYVDSTHTNLADNLGFVATVNSSGLNISRTGARRVNLNAIVATNTSDTDVTQREIKSIVCTITNQAPLFGQRFYRTGPNNINNQNVTGDHPLIYNYKIAANIRDYINNDSQPTIVLSNGVINAAAPAGRALGRFFQPNPAWAIGQKNVPRLQETFLHVRQSGMLGAGQNSSYDIRLAYYLEFWNMGTRDIIVGGDTTDRTVDHLHSDAYLGVSTQVEWARQDSVVKVSPGNFTIPLSDFVDGSGNPLRFKAGELTVLATTQTFPPSDGSTHMIPTGYVGKIYRPNASWTTKLDSAPFRFTGTVEYQPATGGYQNLATLVSRGAQGGGIYTPNESNSNWDTETEVYIGDSNGWIESALGSVVIWPGVYVDSYSNGGNQKANNPRSMHWRGGDLAGSLNNSGALSFISSGSPYQFGDPRANNEQIKFTSASDQTASRTPFIRWRGSQPYQSTVDYSDHADSMGAHNSLYSQFTTSWDEANSYTTTSATNGGGPAYYRYGAMESIGELGHIYDPARGIVSGNVEYARGGGRTLRIGRSETSKGGGTGYAFWDGDPASASRRWAAWRLADFFSVTSDLQSPGLINPNGALRDNGAAIRAVLEGFAFSTNYQLTDAGLTNQKISSSAVDVFVGSLTNYLTNTTNGPLMERGQLSEINFFNTNTLPGVSLPAGINMTNVVDRGREELFRRMVEMITTKGNTFTVYAVGQSLVTAPNQPMRVAATSTRKISYRLTPQYAATNLPFDPSSPSNSLASPTNYAIKELSPSQ